MISRLKHFRARSVGPTKFRDRFVLMLLLFFVASLPVHAGEIDKESLLSGGRKHTYYVFVPKTVSSATPAPLLVLLHGSNHDGLSLIDKWKDLAATEGMILVGPDSLDAAVWAVPADGPDFIHELVESLKTKYRIDPRRVYLFGHSGGAGFALLISLYESVYFAATAIHAGALDKNGIALLPLVQRKIPFHIQVGTVDPLFPLNSVRATRDALNSQGFAAELVEIPNHDHWYYDLAPVINRTAWAFLKQQKLSTDPQFEDHKFRARGTKVANAVDQYNRGLEKQRASDLPAAIAAYSRAIQLDPEFAEAYDNRGISYFNQRESLLAIADFSRSLELKPSDFTYNNRGIVFLSLKRYKEAIEDFTQALRVKPAAEIYNNRGGAYYEDHQFPLAAIDFDEAIKLDPKLARAYIYRGLIQLMDGKVTPAQKDFEQACQLEPRLRDEYEAQIKQLRDNVNRKP